MRNRFPARHDSASPPAGRAAAAAALVLGLAAVPVPAADEWIAGTGDWFTPGNWADGNIPTTTDDAIIDNGGTAQVQAAGAVAQDLFVGDDATGFLEIISGGTLSIRSGLIGDDAGSSGTVTVDGAGSAWTNNDLFVGFRGTGTLAITNGGTVSSSGGGIGINTGSTGTVTVDGAGSTWTHANDLLLGSISSSTGTLAITDGGVVNVDGGVGTLTLASSAGSIGTLNLGAGGAAGVLNAATVDGGAGTATLNFEHTDTDYFFTTDGTAASTAVTITGSTAVNHTGTGTTILTGNNTYTGGTTIDAGTLQLGNGGTTGSTTGDVTNNGNLTFNRSNALTFAGEISGTGTVTQAGTGTTTLTGANTYTGGTTVNFGTLALDGGAIDHAAADIFIGKVAGDDGTLAIINGGTVNSSDTFIANDTGSTGAVTVDGAGSSLSNTGAFDVGGLGTGTLTVRNGGTVSKTGGGQMNIGAVGTGTVKVDGAGSSLSNAGRLIAGNSGDGTLAITGGGAVNNLDGFIGLSTGSTGTVTVDGAGSTWTNDFPLTVGNAGTGTLTITSGGAVSNTIIGTIGSRAGSSGTVTVDGTGSTWTSAGDLRVGLNGAGTLAITGGGVVNLDTGTGTLTLAGNAGSTGTLNLGAGGAAGVLNAATVEGGNGTATLNFNHTDTDYFFTSDGTGTGTAVTITGTTALNHTGTGTTTLTGNNTYTGATTIDNGLLAVNGSIASATTVNTGGTLGGSGTVGAVTVNNGGTLAPGNSIDTLTSGDLSAGAGAMLQFEVDAAGNSDTTAVTGAVTLDSGVDFDVIAFGDLGNLAIRTQHLLIDNDGADAIAGTFTPGPGTLGSDGNFFSLFSTAGGDGNDLTAEAFRTHLTLADGADTTEAVTFPDNFPGFTFNVAGTDSATFSGTFGESATPVSVAKTGTGTLVVTGANTYTGATTIDNGLLVVNGSITSATTVNAGGTLGGTGTVGSVTLNGGTFAPGNSIGTITVAGDVDFSGGGVFEVEVDAAGNADKIEATGTATLTGGTVEVIPLPGDYGLSTDYTILTADGGRVGEFDSVSSTLAFLDPTLTYDANNVFLNLTRNDVSFTEVTGTPNQTAVASLLAELSTTNPGAVEVIINNLLTLTAGGAQQAFESLSGVQHTHAQQLGLQAGRQFRSLLFGRLGGGAGLADAGSPALAFGGERWAHGLEQGYQSMTGRGAGEALAPERGAWLRGFGGFGDIDDDANASGADFEYGGVAAGIDQAFTDELTVGVAVGYSRSDADTAGGNLDVDSWLAAVYAGWQQADYYIHGRLGGGYHEVDSSRRVVVGTLNNTARADYDGYQVDVAVEGGKDITLAADTTMTPFVGLEYTRLERDGFTETGAGAMNLAVDDEEQDSLRSSLGLRLRKTLTTAGGVEITPTVEAAWVREYLDDDSRIRAGFAAAPAATFSVRGPDLDRDRVRLGAGLVARLNDTSSLTVGYQGEFAGSDDNHAFAATLRMRW